MMTDQEINIAVAELCGYHIEQWTEPSGTSYWVVLGPDGKTVSDSAPNYCDDLNACHEMEKTLTVDQIGAYESTLYKVTDYRDSVVGQAAVFWSQHGMYRNIHATARQRCEAFLRVHGKWKE